MDQSSIALLATSALTVLTTYLNHAAAGALRKSGEEFGKSVGDAAAACVRGVYQMVRNRLSGDTSATKALDGLTQAPADRAHQDSVLQLLRKVIAEDPEFARALAGALAQCAVGDAVSTFTNTIHGNVEKLVQIDTVNGDVKL